MKSNFFGTLFLIFFFINSLFAQSKLRESDIPQEVRLGLENAYSDYKLRSWGFETGQYIAFISIDGQEGKCYLAANGNWQFTIFDVPEAQTPTLVMNYFVNNYPGYRIRKCEYVEEQSGDNYYRLLISMKGIAQNEYELIFNPRGNLIKSNAPNPVDVKKDYIARQNPEDIERQQKKAAERESMYDKNILVSQDIAPDGSAINRSKQVDISIPEAKTTIEPTAEILKSFKKKFPRVENIEWKMEEENYIVSFTNRQGTLLEARYKPEGMLINTATHMLKKRYPRPILKDLEKRYPEAKIEGILKVDWDRKYAATVTDRKLKTYYLVELSEKIKGRKEKKKISMTYDNSFRFEGLAGDSGAYE